MTLERRLSQAMVTGHPQSSARLLERLAPEQAAAALEQLGPAASAIVLRRMEPAMAAACIVAWDEQRVGELIEALPPDHAARMLSRTDEAALSRIIDRVSAEAAQPLRQLLARPQGTAGALMDPRPPTLPLEITVAEARGYLERQSRDLLYYVYVVDAEHRLVGVTNLRDLMRAPARRPLSSVIRVAVKRVESGAAWQAIVTHPGWREFHALPVVDERDVLIGVLRYETLRRLESDARRPRESGGLAAACLAFGEVYWDVSAALLEDALDLASHASRGPEPEAHDGP